MSAGFDPIWRQLREKDAEIERLRETSGCLLAGPGRGDCEHFVGLPGKSIPGQHDGQDDTVDAYGKPNGWCWSCWRSYEIERLRADNERLKVAVDIADFDVYEENQRLRDYIAGQLCECYDEYGRRKRAPCERCRIIYRHETWAQFEEAAEAEKENR